MLAAKSIPPLSPWERGEKTRAEQAAELGVSVQWLRKLMAREREAAADGRPNPDDLPYVTLASGDLPDHRPGYLLDSSVPFRDPGPGDVCNVESGRVRVSKGRRLVVRSVNGGKPVEREHPRKKAAKFRPKHPKRKRSLIDT